MRLRRSSTRISLAVAAVLAATGVLVQLVRREPAAATSIQPEAAQLDDARGARLALEAAERPPSDAREPSLPPQGSRASSAAQRESAPAGPATAKVRFSLLARFVAPDQSELAPAQARVEIFGERGAHRLVDAEKQTSVLITGLAPDRYRTRVDAPGFVHLEQVFDLADPAAISRSSNARAGPVPDVTSGAERTADERLVLWPDGWLAVIVRTNDGRPFDALAGELGLEPKRLFAGAFDVRAALAGPDDAVWQRAVDPAVAPALFHPAPGYQSWQLPGGAVGSLKLVRQPPLWIGLAVYGVPLGWEFVAPLAREVVFVLDADALIARCAELRLRVVDTATRAPLPDARVTLRADTSAHRRKDQQDVAPDPDGRVALARVVPGRYELNVERGESLAQQHIELAPGEQRDLGEIALADAPGVEVRVVHEDGQPGAASLELGPYEQGKRVGVLYPAMLHWHTQPPEVFRLPLPSGRSIVRAATDTGRSNGRLRGGQWSENVLLDPQSRPAQPLVLVLREPVDVRFEIAHPAVATVEVVDALGVFVDWPERRDKKGLQCPLIPGRYGARFLDAAGGVLGEVPFQVGDAPLAIAWP